MRCARGEMRARLLLAHGVNVLGNIPRAAEGMRPQMRGKPGVLGQGLPGKQRSGGAAAEMNSGNRSSSISGLVVEYIVAIDVTRVRFPADATLAPTGAGN